MITTRIDAHANERSSSSGKTNSADRHRATVAAENSTARPAVAMLRVMARRESAPRESSSRYRVTMNRA